MDVREKDYAECIDFQVLKMQVDLNPQICISSVRWRV